MQLSEAELLEEVVALVVDQNKGREVDNLDLPDRFHAEFREVDTFDLLDILFGENGSRAANRTEIETAMLVAGVCHLLRAVAFGDHDHRAAIFLQQVDVGIHATGSRRTEGAGSFARRSLGRSGVIDRVVLEVVRQRLAGVKNLLELGVSDVATDDDGTLQQQR